MEVCTWVLLALSLVTLGETRCSHDSIFDDLASSYEPPRKQSRPRPRPLGYVIAKMAQYINKKFKEIDFRLDDLRQINSCSGRCTEEIPGATCQCHHNCGLEENCCSDFVYECDRSCKDICNTAFDDRFACQCDSKCDVFKNCCLNYTTLCKDGSSNSELDLTSMDLDESNEDGDDEFPHDHELPNSLSEESLEYKHLHPDGDSEMPHEHELPNSPSEESLESKHLYPDGEDQLVLPNSPSEESLESQHLHPNGDGEMPHEHELPNSPSEESLESKYLYPNGENQLELPNSQSEESLESQNLNPSGIGDTSVDQELPIPSNDDSLESQHLHPDGQAVSPIMPIEDALALSHLGLNQHNVTDEDVGFAK